MRDPFGWDYPAGAENDPRAPWNQRYDTDEEEEDRRQAIEDAKADWADISRDRRKDGVE